MLKETAESIRCMYSYLELQVLSRLMSSKYMASGRCSGIDKYMYKVLVCRHDTRFFGTSGTNWNVAWSCVHDLGVPFQ